MTRHPVPKYPSTHMVPGGAGGDPCGKEGDEVVDGVGGERQRDRWHQVALNAAA